MSAIQNSNPVREQFRFEVMEKRRKYLVDVHKNGMLTLAEFQELDTILNDSSYREIKDKPSDSDQKALEFFRKQSEIESNTDADLIGQCVNEVLCVLHDRGLNAGGQNKVLHQVRRLIAEHWRANVIDSERQRRDQEMREKELYGFIEGQTPVETP